MTTNRTINKIRRRLLRWYGGIHRNLPWRQTRDPYAIWIAETMLQQTQVRTVVPYYRRFLRSLPTIEALDRAPLEKVLTLWSGLGYYRRAENLKRAARALIADYGGKMPVHLEALRALPGVGPYTAGALMSIAFNKPYPAIDGNARRVLTRLFRVAKERDLFKVASDLVSPSQPGLFNQALMELGATICLPLNPRCPTCPIAEGCAARRTGTLRSQTASSGKRKSQAIEWPLFLIQFNGRLLLRRRPTGGILGGLWEIPGGERKHRESLESMMARHLNGCAAMARFKAQIGEVRHTITYRKIRSPVLLCLTSGKRAPLSADSTWRWSSIAGLARLPLSSLSRKAIKVFLER